MSSNTPSIKGLLLIGAVASVRGAIKAGALDHTAVETRLPSEDCEFLDSKIDPTHWYPVTTMANYLEICVELMPSSRDESLRALGKTGAEHARTTGLYGQLDFEQGKVRDASKQEGEAFARLLATSWSAFYNFGTWRHQPIDSDDALYVVDLLETSELPPILRLATESFMLTVLEWAWDQPLQARTTELSEAHIRFEILPANS